MKKSAILSVILSLLFLVGTFSGCEVVDVSEVLTINGETVTGGEFNFMLESFKGEIANAIGFDAADAEKWKTEEIDNRKAIDVAKDKTIDEIVLIWVQAQKAEAEGVSLTAEELSYVDGNYNALVEQYGGAEAFNKQLSKCQVTKDSVKGLLKKIMVASKLQQKYVMEDEALNNVSEEELQAQYENLKNEFYANSIFAKHILVLFSDPTKGIERTKDEAKAEAQKLLDRVNAGEDFEKLMREYSEDGEVSYDGYSFTHNDRQFVQAFDDGAYALEVGEVSGLVETEYGYHIIKRLPSQETFDAYEDVKDQLKAEVAYERFNAMVKDQWVAEAKVEKNTKVLDKIKS